MKNPNGYGSVFKLSGKRRKPFTARVTAGWDDEGKQLYKYLGYYETRREAMIALAEHNKDPLILDANTITFKEMYERYTRENFYNVDGELKVSPSKINTYRMAYGLSEALHDLKFADMRKNHMQSVIDKSDKAYETKKKIRTLYRQLYQMALENDLVDKDYSSFVDLGKNTTVSERQPFDATEIKILWQRVEDTKYADTVLMMIYTGLRPGELLTIKNEDINIKERYMRGGMKTVAGINRVIPLNKKIIPLIENRMSDKEYLIDSIKGRNNKARYDTYKRDWDALMKHLNMKHNPHDCRHTFATIMDNADANKTSVKRIMGHASRSVTSKVYTHKDIDQLIKAIDLI